MFDKETRNSRGFGFVTYLRKEDADVVLQFQTDAIRKAKESKEAADAGAGSDDRNDGGEKDKNNDGNNNDSDQSALPKAGHVIDDKVVEVKRAEPKGSGGGGGSYQNKGGKMVPPKGFKQLGMRPGHRGVSADDLLGHPGHLVYPALHQHHLYKQQYGGGGAGQFRRAKKHNAKSRRGEGSYYHHPSMYGGGGHPHAAAPAPPYLGHHDPHHPHHHHQVMHPYYHHHPHHPPPPPPPAGSGAHAQSYYPPYVDYASYGSDAYYGSQPSHHLPHQHQQQAVYGQYPVSAAAATGRPQATDGYDEQEEPWAYSSSILKSDGVLDDSLLCDDGSKKKQK